MYQLSLSGISMRPIQKRTIHLKLWVPHSYVFGNPGILAVYVLVFRSGELSAIYRKHWF